MKFKAIYLATLFLAFFSCSSKSEKNYIFFLHNRFIEEHGLEQSHPKYGKAEYYQIIQTFEAEGFEVLSEIRPAKIDAREYALKVKTQIDSLLSKGVAPNNITVIGTSKGGYIAQFVSTFSQNPDLNFVFIGSFMESDIEEIPEINFCGNILTIYEKTDEYGISAVRRKETSNLKIKNFKEVELNTGLEHGFLYKPLKEWIGPSIKWAKQNYKLK